MQTDPTTGQHVDLGDFVCKVCGAEKGHKPSCESFCCPHCHVPLNVTEVHGHHPECPTYVPDPYSTLTLLTDTYRFLRRFIVADEAAFVAGALWVAHTHAFDAADATPVSQSEAPKPSQERRVGSDTQAHGARPRSHGRSLGRCALPTR